MERKYKAAPATVMFWIEHEFRAGLQEDAVIQEAAAVLKVGLDRGDDATECLRRAIASAVLRIAEMDPRGPEGN